MKDTTHKVVILDNITSPYIYQAIIVLKNYNPSLKSQIIKDAEKIVSDYLQTLNYEDKEVTIYKRPPLSCVKTKKRKRTSKIVLSLMAVFLFIGIAYRFFL